MKLDFWNNPIVVSAFRVKYRRGGLSSKVVLYLLVLTTGGAVIEYYNAELGGRWQRIYYLSLMVVQFLVSVFAASISTAVSMRTEVVNRTLDFQRIAALSPRQILLGKLLGEPALAYLLAVATVPLAVWCWLFGGVTFEVMVLVYVTLATSTLLSGSFGLIIRLEPRAGKTANNTTGGEGVLFGLLGGLLLPLPIAIGLMMGDVWRVAVPVFGLEVPALLLVPVVQLVLAVLPFQAMVRLLIHPQNPLLSKPTAYATLAVIDLSAGAVLYDGGNWALLGWSFTSRGVTFWLVHLIAGIILMNLITPRGEILETWVWRFRGRSSYLRDMSLGDRSPNGLALLAFCGIGITAFLLLVWLPAACTDGFAAVGREMRGVLPAFGVTLLVTLAFGVLYQLLTFRPLQQKSAIWSLAMMAVFIPHLLAKFEQLPVELLLDLSLVDQFRYWLFPRINPLNKPFGLNPRPDPLNPLPLVAIFGLLLVVSEWALRSRLRQLQTTVEGKLCAMGVAGTAR